MPFSSKAKWGVIGSCVPPHVIVFENSEGVKSINGTFISIIPKVEVPKHIKQFRPISLCNVV